MEQLINNITERAMGLNISARYWHLQTKSYAEHNAFATLYDNIGSIADELVECYQGKTGKRVSSPNTISISEYTSKDTALKEFSNLLKDAATKLSVHLDLQDIILAMWQLISKIRYLLTLK